MCESKVYMEKEGNLVEFMENVITIKPERDKLLLVDLFGEQKFVEADVKEIKFLDHKVILTERKKQQK
ncbi:MAG: CooT family nickel-binding protein [Actinomycetota bacterium]|nr:CooT family nickel-binding protein [Actinomycetota bacterium]